MDERVKHLKNLLGELDRRRQRSDVARRKRDEADSYLAVASDLVEAVIRATERSAG